MEPSRGREGKGLATSTASHTKPGPAGLARKQHVPLATDSVPTALVSLSSGTTPTVAAPQAEKSFDKTSQLPRPFSFQGPERLGDLPRSSESKLRGAATYPSPTSHPWGQDSRGNGRAGPDSGREA